PDAMIIFGAAIDEALDDEIRVTVIATGFDGKNPTLPQGGPSKPNYDASYNRRPSEPTSAVGSFAPPSTEIPPWIRGR
ncbi:MAG: cell division protein FtsZ, partial [Acidaminococcaceae bacterium]